MRVAVLGAGSWGTTVASLAAARNETTLWARGPDVAAEIRDEHTNAAYLPGFELPKQLHASSDLEEVVRDADVLIAGVPSHGFREVLEQAVPHVRPWIPIVSLTKGFEAGTLLRMTEVIKDVMPGHPAAALSGPKLGWVASISTERGKSRFITRTGCSLTEQTSTTKAFLGR